MGLFRKKPKVHVYGLSELQTAGADGRYDKQMKARERSEKKRARRLLLETHTPAELRGFIEATYNVSELDHTDTRYKEAYMGVKGHLCEQYAPELLTTKAVPLPNHPPISENDPDYAAYYAAKDARFQEAILLPREAFPMHLHVYNIALFQGETPVSWVEVYVESDHEYLAFKVIDLEYDNHYKTQAVIHDIVTYFGASKADKRANNERYIQFCSVQL